MPDRFEREIEDILNKLDKFPTQSRTFRVRRAVAKRAVSFQRNLALGLARLSLSQIMLAGIALVLFGYFFRAALPVWYYVVVLGLLLFFTSFILSFVGGGRGPGRHRQVYWRGRPADSYYSSGPPLADRLRQWWRRRQGRR